jgi:hypothetical protein
MCIYCGTNKYRKIYENHYGSIPKDETGRTYEIHHIDGNHSNNNPANLKCVSIQEHYDIHYSQGDWAACLLISLAMNISPEEKSELSRKSALSRVSDGSHNLLKTGCSRESINNSIHQRIETGTHHFLNKEWAKEKELEKVRKGTHQFLKKQDGSSEGLQANLKRVTEGTHNFLGPEMNERMFDAGTHPIQRMLATGTHPSHKTWTCEKCDKIGKGMSQYHRHLKGRSCVDK